MTSLNDRMSELLYRSYSNKSLLYIDRQWSKISWYAIDILGSLTVCDFYPTGLSFLLPWASVAFILIALNGAWKWISINLK